LKLQTIEATDLRPTVIEKPEIGSYAEWRRISDRTNSAVTPYLRRNLIPQMEFSRGQGQECFLYLGSSTCGGEHLKATIEDSGVQLVVRR